MACDGKAGNNAASRPRLAAIPFYCDNALSYVGRCDRSRQLDHFLMTTQLSAQTLSALANDAEDLHVLAFRAAAADAAQSVAGHAGAFVEHRPQAVSAGAARVGGQRKGSQQREGHEPMEGERIRMTHGSSPWVRA